MGRPSNRIKLEKLSKDKFIDIWITSKSMKEVTEKLNISSSSSNYKICVSVANTYSLTKADLIQQTKFDYKSYQIEYRKINKDKLKTQEKQYRLKNAKIRANRQKQYRKNNPEIVKANRHNYKARIRYNTVNTRITGSLLSDKFNYWGNKCWMCSSTKNLVADHVKPLSKGGLNCISNIRPACDSCNLHKSNKWMGVDKLHFFVVK